ncbi:MAG: hypothetical protein V1929_10225, partial [bacterium]
IARRETEACHHDRFPIRYGRRTRIARNAFHHSTLPHVQNPFVNKPCVVSPEEISNYDFERMFVMVLGYRKEVTEWLLEKGIPAQKLRFPDGS